MSQTVQISSKEDICDLLLKEPKIRFAGIINNKGRLVSGGFSRDTIPYEKDEKRKMINEAKEDLNQLLFALHAPTQIKLSELVKGATHSGEPIEGLTIKKLATSEQIVEKGVFNVVFEICTMEPVVSPVVTVKSDSETKKVIFTERIIANSCQVSGTKIMAASENSIQVGLGDTNERSGKISNLESQLKMLLDEISAEKKELQQLLAKQGNESEIVQKAIKIEDLRTQILKIKATLYNELYHSFE